MTVTIPTWALWALGSVPIIAILGLAVFGIAFIVAFKDFGRR